MIKLTTEQRIEMVSAVSRANTENMIKAMEMNGHVSEEEQRLIELCSAVSAGAIGLALQYLYELDEEYH